MTVKAARLHWHNRQQALSDCERRDGCCFLRRDVSDWQPEEPWQACMQLTEVAAVFRFQKDPLELRPVWRQKQGRVPAHIPACFLAYVVRAIPNGGTK